MCLVSTLLCLSKIIYHYEFSKEVEGIYVKWKLSGNRARIGYFGQLKVETSEYQAQDGKLCIKVDVPPVKLLQKEMKEDYDNGCDNNDNDDSDYITPYYIADPSFQPTQQQLLVSAA